MKISRKEIRRMILEQIGRPTPQGPFLIMVVDRNYGEVNEVFITKVLPEEEWWFSEGGGGYSEEEVVNIIDMATKQAVDGAGLPGGKITFRGGYFAEIGHPEGLG